MKKALSMDGLGAIVTLLTLHGFHMVSSKGNALLEAQTKGHEDLKHTVCIQYNPQFSEIASSLNSADPMTLIDLSKFQGCAASDYSKHWNSSIAGSAVAISRGNCTFSKKADLVQSVNGSSVLIVDYSNSTAPVFPEGNATFYKEINITVTCIAWQDYHNVLALPAPVELRIYKPESSKFDPNMIIIVFASTMTVLVGALWSVAEEKAKIENLRRKRNADRERGPSGDEENSEQTEKDVEITPCIVIVWVASLCGVLLLLYFFFNVMVYFFIATFVIAGASSMHTCIMPLWRCLVPFNEGFPLYRVPCIRSKVEIRSIVLLVLCISVAVYWAVERHASFAWIIQDIMGVAFCVSIMKVVHLPSLKILTFMMVLLFCYDVFFVFITPLFTKNGQSVMVNVATGGNGDSGEMIPLVFLVPILSDGPDSMCRDRAFSMLGFGDVILPGLLIGFNGLYGVHAKTKLYLVFSTLAYAVGMSCCLIALIFMDQGQPALFYLVPTTLLTTYAVALKRGEVRLMWKGVFPPSTDDMPSINNNWETDDDVDDEEGLTPVREEEEHRNLINK